MRFYLLLFFLSSSLGLQATNYYVSTTGSNANPGTEDSPFRTIQHAINTAGSDLETLFIEGGVYNERVTMTTSGSLLRPITITSYSGTAIIDGSGFALFAPHDGIFELRGCSHVIIDNIRVRNSAYIGILVFGNNISNITIRNCSTFDTGGSGIYANGQAAVGSYGISDILIENNEIELAINLSPGGFEECISLTEGVENFVIRNNRVHNGGRGTIVGGPIGIDAKNGVRNGEIYRNVVYDINNSSAGIYVDAYERAALNIRIYQNEVFNCEDIGISIGAEQGGTVDNIYVYNNLIYNNGSDGIKITGFSTDGSPNDIRRVWIYNNTVYGNGYQNILGGSNQGGAMWIEGDTDTITIKNNIFVGNNFNNGVHIYLSNQSKVVASHNLIYQNRGRSWPNPPMSEVNGQNPVLSDADFVDVNNLDFTLNDLSPAIDAGDNQLFPPVDFNNDPRPSNGIVDLGAFEYQLNSLPVSLAFFSAKHVPEANYVDLNWATYTELDFDQFEIERSIDGVIFSSIGQLKGAGNSQDRIAYNFKDHQLTHSTQYYRLKQLDLDESFEYSDIIAVNINAKSTAFELFPNPINNNRITLRSNGNTNDPLTILLFDLSGQLLQTHSVELNKQADTLIDLGDLSNGIYTIGIQSNETIYYKKLIKQ